MMIGDKKMQRINLREYYPFCEESTIEVSDEVLAVLQGEKRRERSYIERVRRNKAYYSLDLDDGAIENDALFLSPSPETVVERRQITEEVYAALDSLPDKQRRRVYAQYILGFSQTEIASAEGVDLSAVSRSIGRGLEGMKKFLAAFFG